MIMKSKNSCLFFLALMVTGALLMISWTETACAQQYPTKPIRLVVAYPPGGTSDIAARLLANWIIEKKKFPQPVMVVNRPGGAGSIGQTEVMNAPPDGYTLLLSAQMAAAMPIILPEPPFEMEKRTWLGNYYVDPYLFFVKGDSEFKTLKEVVNRAKADPANFSWGTSGPTGAAAFMIGLLLHINGIPPMSTKMVSYQGGGEYINAVAGGHVMFSADSQIKGLVAAGKLRALAAVYEKRHPQFPDVPTVAEAGYPGFPPEFVPNNGIEGPPGLPSYVVEPWIKVIREATEDPDFRKQSEGANKIVAYWTPEESKRVMFRNHEVFKEIAPLLGLVKKK